jgi:hypothetical protein
MGKIQNQKGALVSRYEKADGRRSHGTDAGQKGDLRKHGMKGTKARKDCVQIRCGRVSACLVARNQSTCNREHRMDAAC